MTWGAHKADVRIAAKNSVTVRAALRTSINAKAIWHAYQDTHPFVTDNITQDRARARAWAMLHVKIDIDPIEAALKKVYTDGFLLGLDASREAVAQGQKVHKKTADITKSDSDYIDWAHWKPGNRAAALQYRPTGAFKTILDNAGIVSKSIAKAGYDKIGTALADSVAAGFSPARAAKVITEKIGDPARALTIAITEQNRAMSLAAMQNYKDLGVEKVEWSGANPCDICAPNEGQVVVVGEQFESEDTEPPVHPNCRCAVLPVIDEAFYGEPSATDGLDLLPSGEEAPVEEKPIEAMTTEEQEAFGEKQYKALKDTITGSEQMSMAMYKGPGYYDINYSLRHGGTSKDADFIQNVIERAPALEKPVLTFRGINNHYSASGNNFAEELTKAQPGSIYQDLGFSSTSFKPGVAGSFGDIHIEIENPVGTKGIVIEKIISGLPIQGESEWLLPKGIKFEVISNTPAQQFGHNGPTIRVRVIK